MFEYQLNDARKRNLEQEETVSKLKRQVESLKVENENLTKQVSDEQSTLQS